MVSKWNKTVPTPWDWTGFRRFQSGIKPSQPSAVPVVDVEMSLMSADDDELCSDDAVQMEPTKSDIELVPNPAAGAAAEMTRLAVPTIVVKAESEPESRTLVAAADDDGENGCPSDRRFGMLSAREPDLDTISIRSFTMSRRLSFMAIKNTAGRLQRSFCPPWLPRPRPRDHHPRERL